MKLRIVLFLPIALILFGCHEHPVPQDKGTVSFLITHKVDGEPLEFDTLKYSNASGNKYSVQKLHYYISDIQFLQNDQIIYSDSTIHYIDARDPFTSEIVLNDVAIGEYSGISFLIGLNEDANKTGLLPATWDNINMGWPDPMGGGYHFLKLEGHFQDSLSNSGYAIHVGTNLCLIKVNVDHPFSVKHKTPKKSLSMNINNWFTNPINFDLSEGNYTMGIQDKMLQIAQNGHDVFSME